MRRGDPARLAAVLRASLQVLHYWRCLLSAGGGLSTGRATACDESDRDTCLTNGATGDAFRAWVGTHRAARGSRETDGENRLKGGARLLPVIVKRVLHPSPRWDHGTGPGPF